MEKIKITWGTGILLAIIGFISFIMYFVITMLTDSAYSHDLVTEDYYKTEIAFQEQLDKTISAQTLVRNVEIKRVPEGLLILFPERFLPHEINGKVFLYRPSNKRLDREIPISLSSHQLLVPDESLIGGRWNINIDWSVGAVGYFYKKQITY